MSSIPENFPTALLLKTVLIKDRDDHTQFRQALRMGRLKSYLAAYIWCGTFDEQLVDLYQFHPFIFHAKYMVDLSVCECSTLVDKVYGEFYKSKQTQMGENDYGVVASIKSFQSVPSVVHPLKKLKVGCVMGSIMCAGFSVAALARGRLPTATALVTTSAELMKVSYNCYDKRYGELYLHKLTGSPNALLDTTFGILKSAVGLCPCPLVTMCTEIDGALLVQDTIAQQILLSVS